MNAPDKNQIVSTAIELAGQTGWANLLLSDIARALNCSISDIQRQFHSKDAIAEAWFDRIDTKTLQICERQIPQITEPLERIQFCIMTWFRQLQDHKPTVKAMLLYKLEPGHIHLQAQGLTRISRTVQWFLDVCQRKSPGGQQIYDEVTTTAAFLASFAKFFSDNSAELMRTEQRLRRTLWLAQQGRSLLTNLCGTTHTTRKNTEDT